MANKIRFYETWDFKSILTSAAIISILLIFLAGYYFYPSILNKYKLSKYDSITTGRILLVDEQLIIRQTQLGNKTIIDHFNIHFSYELEGKIYNGTDEIQNTLENRTNLKSILSSSDSLVNVKYFSNNPANSILDLTN